MSLVDSAWPKFNRDLKNTGISPYNSLTDGTLKWKVQIDPSDPTIRLEGPLSIGADGCIYFGVYNVSRFYAVNPDGTVRWTQAIHSKVGPAIEQDGTIYVGSSDNYLYALNPDGSIKWSYNAEYYILSPPTIDSDGTIYVGCDGGYMNAINPDGTHKWRYKLNTVEVRAGAALGDNGIIYYPTYGDGIFGLDRQGQLIYHYMSTNSYRASAVIGPDGSVYVVSTRSSNNTLIALNYDLTTYKWSVNVYYSVYGTPALSPDGSQIYVPKMETGVLAAYSVADGSHIWDYTTGGTIYSSPAVSNNGLIYFGSTEGFYCLNPDGSLRWEYVDGSTSFNIFSPAISEDGTVYVGGSDGCLYAFESKPPIYTKAIRLLFK